MGKEEQGKRNGIGPFKDSFRSLVEGKEEGRRIEAGEECPEEDLKEEDRKVERLKWW